MSTLSLYIWEGDGISDAYHDDGTLVVLAESPEQAREMVRSDRAAKKAARDYMTNTWDGSEEALAREPDRTLPVDAPAIVAFNGGGYD